MNILDLILLAAFIAAICIFIKKRQKNKSESTSETENGMANYNALRAVQQGNAPIHGVSIVSLYYDSASSYANMEKDGTNTSFDLSCESKVNSVITSLKADGYAPTVNALACVDRVIFYITY